MKANFKKSFWKKAAAGLMAIGLFALAGCGTSGAGNADDKIGRDPKNPPVYTSEETFRTAAWGLPPNAGVGSGKYKDNPNYATAENYKTMADCGFVYAMPTQDFNDDNVFNTLEVAQAAGMKVLVRDLHPQGVQYSIQLGGTYEEARARFNARTDALKARYDKFKEYESFAGVLAYDEPDTTLYPAIAAGQDWFLKHYPEYEYYVNLLPNYASANQLFGADANKGYTYADHVSMFVEEVNPTFISYDHYPIVQDVYGQKALLDDFYYNLYVFANESKKNDIPFYIYLQTMGFHSNAPLESYAEFAWQSYTSMAFGVRGIQCFCYWTLMEETNNVTSGCVDRDGTILPTYGWVQTVFNEIKSFEEVYMSFDWDGFKLYEASSVENDMFSMIGNNQLEELKGVKSLSADQDLIVGQFLDDEGYPAFMVSNASSPFLLESANVTMEFDSSVTTAIVYAKGEKRTVKLDNHKLTLELGSGEGYFVLPL